MSDSYKIKHHGVEAAANESTNPLLSEVLEARFSRRSLLQGSGALGVAGVLSGSFATLAEAASAPFAKKTPQLGFKPVPFGFEDKVVVPEGYTAEVLYAWGDPVGIKGNMPAFKQDASNSAAEQEVQAGMHHDGMHYYPLPLGATGSKHGLLAINHEYTDDGLLHVGGMKPWNGDKVKKAQAAVGVSVIEVEDTGKGWQVVRPSKYARRITANTPIAIGGPARGNALMKTEADPQGVEILGTFQNCASGPTPWGTYLTCEENFDGVFVNESGNLTELEKRYGISNKDAGYRWAWEDFRFDLQLNPNEANRFGWVVEIDPFDPAAKPVKRTALGRFKHEGATTTIAANGQVVVYMGDDQRFEYIYKFVSKNKYNPKNRKANMQLLEEGTLYVARFDADGSGQWLPLVHGQNGLTAENGFADQGDVVIKARMAADKLGATKMDRPEWIAVDPRHPGSVYCTLTNNSDRGKEGKPGTDAANPRNDNKFGHILHWQEKGSDAAALGFKWDIFVLAGRPDAAKPEHVGNIKGDAFGSPDGLKFDHNGVLWVQTDVSTSTVNMKEYQDMGNNQMVAVVPETGEFRRFLTGPNGCEITGLAFTPDMKTMFVNIQHPGEPDSERNDPAKPTAISTWPDGPKAGRPRAGTVVVRKLNGGVIGS
ncbi:PhoX family phosphatase [Vogesella sp. LYT5W]|uniref:PhoX family phosphatase n=1 Tax=Vogesella margarita TaxID=2984199 RepID=A0ABT5IRV2_9NEIS|nr:PhoX family phosphatase [Vogesella margarita]MDC7715269.1 PhoX family phosphatase [Vogesella margarita]